MAVTGLDHVNIVTADIEGTKRFYKTLLGLVDGDTSAVPPGIEVHWLADASGRSIIHLQRTDAQSRGTANLARNTGAIDHVAFDCDDFTGMQARCAALGVPHRTGLVTDGLSQLFVTDPNNVLLELNFRC